jgi:hypothetical protein
MSNCCIFVAFLLAMILLPQVGEARCLDCLGSGGLQCYCCSIGRVLEGDQTRTWQSCSCCATDPASPDSGDLLLPIPSGGLYLNAAPWPEFNRLNLSVSAPDPPLKPPEPFAEVPHICKYPGNLAVFISGSGPSF